MTIAVERLNMSDTIAYVRDNILNATEDFILHQVNCQGAMGAGLARQIAEKWPLVKTEYLDHCRCNHPHDLLGTVQFVNIGNGQEVVNVFGQLKYGRHELCYTNYEALREAFTFINSACAGKSIAIPYNMGCGLGRGKWSAVRKLVEDCFTNCNVSVYILKR